MTTAPSKTGVALPATTDTIPMIVALEDGTFDLASDKALEAGAQALAVLSDWESGLGSLRQAATKADAAMPFAVAGQALAFRNTETRIQLALVSTVLIQSGACAGPTEVAALVGCDKSGVSQWTAFGAYVLRHGVPDGVAPAQLLTLAQQGKTSKIVREGAKASKRSADKAIRDALNPKKAKRSAQPDGGNAGDEARNKGEIALGKFLDAAREVAENFGDISGDARLMELWTNAQVNALATVKSNVTNKA